MTLPLKALPSFEAARYRACASRQARPSEAPRFPIWLCSVWGLPSRSVTGPLVRSYRTFSPLPLIAAVFFLWHFPSLTGPRTTRHTTLWSSDFPRRFHSGFALRLQLRAVALALRVRLAL
jgi:hypothetical protein